MSSGDQVKTVDMVEVIGDFGSENPACSSCINGPILDIFGVGPHQISKWTFVRDFNLPIDGSDLVDGFDLRTETTVNTESFSVDDGSERKVVEDFCAVFPGIGVAILSVDFIVKTIDGGNLSELNFNCTCFRDFL